MKLRRALALPRRELFLVAEVLVALGFTQALLRVCHFQRIRRILTYLAKAGRWKPPLSVSADTLVWAVATAKSCSPMRTTCLGEALMAEALFRQHGYSPVLRLGAMRRDGVFQAHAWLELNNTVVIGGPAPVIQKYTPFSPISWLSS